MKIKNILAALALAMLIPATIGCSDDKDLIPLSSTTGETKDGAYNTLTFRWDKVEGAVQYSYQLAETATGKVLTTDVTPFTTATFNGLEPDTEYTLTVYAYAALGGDKTTSEPIVITGRTADLTDLATPVPTMSREVNTVIINWETVAGTVDYEWTLTAADGTVVKQDETYVNYATITGLEDGNYTFTVVARTNAEGYRNSQPGSVEFEFVREHEEIWYTDGTYTSALTGTSWTAKLIAYDDNSYTIVAWYGQEGYDFSFTLDESDANNMFHVSADQYTYNSADQSYSVATGIASPATVKVFPTNNQCTFAGDVAKGTIEIKVSAGSASGMDKFEWGGLTIDDLVGEWTLNGTYDFYGEDLTETSTVTFTKLSDTTMEIALPNVYKDYGIETAYGTMVIDFETLTFTIDPYIGYYDDYYDLAGSESPTSPIRGTIRKDAITITDFGIWYGEENDLGSYSAVYSR